MENTLVWVDEETVEFGKELFLSALTRFRTIEPGDVPTAFVRIPRSVASGTRRLTGAQVLAYAALVDAANNSTRVARYSAQRLSEAAGVTARSVSRILEVLEEKKLIRRLSQNELFVCEPGQHWVQVPLTALWTASPRLWGAEMGGTPRTTSTAALRALLGLLLAVDWESWQVSRSQQSLAAQAGMSLTQFKQGLAELTLMGLVVLHPQKAWRQTETGWQRQVVPVRVKWSAVQWSVPSSSEEAPVLKNIPTPPKPVIKKKELSAHARIFRAFYSQYYKGRYSQSTGSIAQAIQHALTHHSEERVAAAVSFLGREALPITPKSLSLEIQKMVRGAKTLSSSPLPPTFSTRTRRDLFRAQREAVGVGVDDSSPW